MKAKIAAVLGAAVLALSGCSGGTFDGYVHAECDPTTTANVTTCSVTQKPIPTETVTVTATPTPTATATPTPAPTATATPTPTPTATATPTPTPTATTTPAAWWKPTGGYTTQWQWQLSAPNPAYITGVNIYGFDGFDGTAAHVANLESKGAKSICYISAGSWEDWRSDAGTFPASVKGNNLDGWAGEKWLDVRNLTVLKPIMEKRADMCEAKGFHAVEWDNVDGYTNNTGFPLTAANQIAYNKMLAEITHARGMGVALKNDVDQLTALEPYFDFAINEECFAYSECAGYSVFRNKGKLVLNVEYETLKCTQAKSLDISSMKKNLSLNAARTPCV